MVWGVQDGEEHVVHTDPEGENGDGAQGEARIAPQRTRGEPDVLHQRVECRHPPLIAVRLLHGLDAAERPARGEPRVVL